MSSWSRQFTVVLIPAVVGEIDRHKNEERKSGRQEKAARIARQIGEYRRRGRLIDGVPVVHEMSTILAIATEPRIEPFVGGREDLERFVPNRDAQSASRDA